ncbi:hypothetical protein BDZ90DRAFT_232724 [Jaminaea rosea]|uniref:Alpha/beta-hydrolase n=1 Tax=Jaminaea rosea TaxID=1569628 RepID=A0A316UPE6_9BASI|nr:hypothetical protein BDZ90DRAFT_232724 [Jaminaea rosea]PWN27169.1 hypothetical protein BDZ90DRAFT_232724 [Jaminaea rosea]
MHGRGSDANDITSAFLPILQMRYGGKARQVTESQDGDKDEAGEVTVLAIEAKDGSWYPQSHNATESALTEDNEPFQYSALDKIRSTILFLHYEIGLPLDSIVFAGFSQGGLLADTYLLAGLDQLLDNKEDEETVDDHFVPLPGYMLSLAGSVFKTPPRFPSRGHLNETHREKLSSSSRSPYHGKTAPPQPSSIRARLICGTQDRFFTPDEIKEAARQIGEKAGRVREEGKGTDVVVSVAFDEGQGHVTTDRMIAAVIQSVDEILRRG